VGLGQGQSRSGSWRLRKPDAGNFCSIGSACRERFCSKPSAYMFSILWMHMLCSPFYLSSLWHDGRVFQHVKPVSHASTLSSNMRFIAQQMYHIFVIACGHVAKGRDHIARTGPMSRFFQVQCEFVFGVQYSAHCRSSAVPDCTAFLVAVAMIRE